MKRIIGCGNLLLRDEGIGVHLIEYLKKQTLPDDVELVDGATSGFDLIPVIQEAERVVIVDAIQAGGAPGDMYRFSAEDLTARPVGIASLHDISLSDVLSIIRTVGTLPPVTIIGVQPKDTAVGMELSAQVAELLPRLSSLVLEEINHA